MNTQAEFIIRKPSSLKYYQEGPPDHVDLNKWCLTITGLAGDSVKLGYDDIMKLPQVTDDRRTVCVCNWSIRHHFTGVRLYDLLQQANVNLENIEKLYLCQTSIGTPEKGTYKSTVPLRDALQRKALLCHSIDHETLTLERGYPLRFIDFGLYSYKCVKGLAQLEITTEYALGEWERRAGYPLDGTIKPKKYWICDLREKRFVTKPGEVTEF